MFTKLIGKRPNRRPFRPDENPDTVTTTAIAAATAPAAVVGGGTISGVVRGNGVVNSTVNHALNGVVGSVTATPPPAYSSLEPLPFLRDVPIVDRYALFLAKLKLCCVIFNLGEPGKHMKEKELKRQTLLELVDHVSSSGGGGASSKFPEAILEDLFKMISANLFRALPPSAHENPSALDSPLDPEDDDSAMDPNWPHLQLVYELLLRYVVSPDADPKTAKKYIDQTFVLKLLDLFDSEDPRERDYLKIILHRIYGKFMAHRPFIRKSINNIFYRLIFEAESHSGISELLEILGSIVNGFALPLKEEHKLFLVRALIPLHKPKCVVTYHSQLSYCIAQFVEKDSNLADTIIRGLLKYWPVTNSHKELLFLGELELVLEATTPAQFQCCMIPLFRQIARCLNSPHFQVAERTLFLWNNEHINTLVSQNRKVILPLIFSALERNSRSHWNKAVNGLTEHVRKMFMDMDEELFEECQKKYMEEEANAEREQEGRVATWKYLEALAAANQPILALSR